MSDLASIKRSLKIKTGSVTRLYKEYNLYQKEAQQQQSKVDTLVADNVEGWDLNNGRRMLEESDKMVTDSSSRLVKAVAGLRDLVVSVKEDSTLSKDDEDLLKAEEAVKLVKM